MRKLIRKWWKKLKVGIVAAGKSENLTKVGITAAIVVASTTAQAQYRQGGDAEPPQQWSVWASIWNSLKEPWVWIYGAGQISHAFDINQDPAPAYWSATPITPPNGPQAPAGGEGKIRSKNP